MDILINGRFVLNEENIRSVQNTLNSLMDTLGDDFSKAITQAVEDVQKELDEISQNQDPNKAYDANSINKSYDKSEAERRAKEQSERKSESDEDEESEHRGWAGNRFNKYADFIKYLKTPSDEKNKEQGQKYIVKAMHQSAEVLKTGIKTGFGIVEDIYNGMKSASPLLQSIETLFNLAMQLFFMPLGNKIAETLIPATIELVDSVVKMWDSFEGKSLPEMLDYAFSVGVKLFGQYFNNIGETLSNQGGLLSGIGNILQTIGAFIEGPGIELLNNILKVINTVLSNLKYFIGAWVALKAVEFTMEAANAFSLFSGKSATAAIGITTAIGLGAGLATVGAANVMGMATGGYVAPKEGGSLRLLAEAGEGEYVVPESKVSEFVSTHRSQSTTDNVFSTHASYDNSISSVTNTSSESSHPIYITYNINGYTDSELKNIIMDTMTEQVLKSAYKG